MADYTLGNGREITFDLHKLNMRQWRGLFDASESDERSDETLARVAGLSADEMDALDFIEYKQLFAAFLRKTREPLANPT